MQTKNKGFTLIELMIVVAIVAILAAVAIPAYQDYLKRSKISEVAATAGACKTGVSEYAASTNTLPADANTAGCSTDASTYVSNLTVADGVISVTIANIDGDLDGQNLILTPASDAGATTRAVNGDTIVAWHCGTAAAATLYKYFPASCRQAAI